MTLSNNDNKAYYFAPDLIEQINHHSNLEIACHTFSHFYCLESGQTVEQFRIDLQLSRKAAEEKGIDLKSLVFPRNQINEEYLTVCVEEGFEVVRGNEQGWMYKASEGSENTRWKRLVRLIDTYMNISGHNCYNMDIPAKESILVLPASRFLRPYSKKLFFLEWLKLRRIKKDMTYAAKYGKIFHLWWHPHNFGNYQNKNFANLLQIVNHYKRLNEKYGFTSLSMKEISAKIINAVSQI